MATTGAELPPQVVDALLDRLASDDAFREHFARAPDQALRTLGFEFPAGLDCCREPVKQLASKETIAATRDALRDELVGSELSQGPNSLDLGPKAGRRA